MSTKSIKILYVKPEHRPYTSSQLISQDKLLDDQLFPEFQKKHPNIKKTFLEVPLDHISDLVYSGFCKDRLRKTKQGGWEIKDTWDSKIYWDSVNEKSILDTILISGQFFFSIRTHRDAKLIFDEIKAKYY